MLQPYSSGETESLSEKPRFQAWCSTSPTPGKERARAERDILEKSQRQQEIVEKFLRSPGGPKDSKRTESRKALDTRQENSWNLGPKGKHKILHSEGSTSTECPKDEPRPPMSQSTKECLEPRLREARDNPQESLHTRNLFPRCWGWWKMKFPLQRQEKKKKLW